MKNLIIIIGLLLITVIANATPFPKGQKVPLSLPLSFTSNYDFEGIVALNNCSGSIIRFENSKDTDKATILTNGHCFEGGFAKPGQYFYNLASKRSFNVLDPKAQVLGKIQATKMMYATMTGTDISLYLVNESYADIKNKFNVRPLTLISHRPMTNDPIEVISGFWKKGYNCHIETFVEQLKEENWLMTDSIRYTRPGCETVGGTSGSPVILAGTRNVIAINNTGNENGEKCTENNPCEIDSTGNITFAKGYSYAQQTYWIYSCLNSNNEIDVAVPGCQLQH